VDVIKEGPKQQREPLDLILERRAVLAHPQQQAGEDLPLRDELQCYLQMKSNRSIIYQRLFRIAPTNPSSFRQKTRSVSIYFRIGGTVQKRTKDSVIPDLARRRRDPAMPWLQADLVRSFDKLCKALLLLRVLQAL